MQTEGDQAAQHAMCQSWLPLKTISVFEGLMVSPKPRQKACMLSRRLCSPPAVQDKKTTSLAYTRHDFPLPEPSCNPACGKQRSRWASKPKLKMPNKVGLRGQPCRIPFCWTREGPAAHPTFIERVSMAYRDCWASNMTHANALQSGFERAFRNPEAAPCQGLDAQGAWPPALMQCSTLSTGRLTKCRWLPPAVLQPAGAEGSTPWGSEGAVEPCLQSSLEMSHGL